MAERPGKSFMSQNLSILASFSTSTSPEITFDSALIVELVAAQDYATFVPQIQSSSAFIFKEEEKKVKTPKRKRKAKT